jgi:hypothetical protein
MLVGTPIRPNFFAMLPLREMYLLHATRGTVRDPDPHGAERIAHGPGPIG